MRIALRYLLFSALLVSASSCANPSREALQICGFSFDLEASAFRLLSYDEASCSAFVEIGMKSGVEETGSIIALNRPPEVALPSLPSNFFIAADGSVSHRDPESVSDDKNFYYVDDIKALGNEKHSLPDHSRIELFKYRRTVTNIDQNGEESSRAQACADILKYSNRSTVLFAGCVDQSDGPSLYDRSLNLMRAAGTPDSNPE